MFRSDMIAAQFLRLERGGRMRHFNKLGVNSRRRNRIDWRLWSSVSSSGPGALIAIGPSTVEIDARCDEQLDLSSNSLGGEVEAPEEPDQ